ncbi:MAG TPA: hypothetical protein VFS43_13365 [Polyangiaceae bacterium]|nr:hypothetical protein [Polyangiaceae bacterium]
MNLGPKKAPSHSHRQGRCAKHRTIKASEFLKQNATTAQQEKADDPGAKLGGNVPGVIRTLPLKSERAPELTCEPAPPQGASGRGNGQGPTEEEVALRQLFVGMMCEAFLGPLMTCGICRRRPLDVGAGFVTLEPSHDAAKDLVVGRVVCGACVAEHGPDEERLVGLFEARSVGVPRSYGDSSAIAFVGRPFDRNIEVAERGRR